MVTVNRTGFDRDFTALKEKVEILAGERRGAKRAVLKPATAPAQASRLIADGGTITADDYNALVADLARLFQVVNG